MPEENINIELLKALNENIKNPFIAVSPEGNIISSNKQALTYFAIKEPRSNIFDFLTESSAVELSRLIEEVLTTKRVLTKNIILTPVSGADLKFQVTVNQFNQSLILLTFKPEEHRLRINEITKLKIKQEELFNLINNHDIERIINSIKELFPFTVIGKEKIRKEIDSLEEFFWIINNDGSYILVNKNLASNLGLSSTQLEGRSETELLPAYLHEIYLSIEKYVRDSLNIIVLEGIPIQGLSALSDYQTIEIPLTDSDGNPAAIIGISRKTEKREIISKVEERNLLENIPAALAMLDNSGLIKHSSKDFCKLFSEEFSDLRNLSYTKVFPLEISDKIKKFFDLNYEIEEFQVKISGRGERKDKEFNVTIKQNKGENNEPEGISILLEDVSAFVDLERIINSRGKMYEVLIQNNPEPIIIYEKENLHFLEVNQAALNLYGYRRDEFLQMDLTDLYAPEDIQTLLDTSSSETKEGVFSGPFRHKKKNGESVFVEICKSSFKFNNKDAHFNVIRDVTKYLGAEREKQLYKAAFDNASNLLLITDSSGFIKSVNIVTVNQLGIRNTELINASFASLVKDDDRALVNTKIFNSGKQETISLSTSLKKADGELFDVEVKASPVLNYKNETELFVLVLKPLIKETVPKEPRVKEIIVEKIVEKQAEPSEKIDPSFLSGIFHEILTPINAMLGFVQELTESIEKVTPEQLEAKDIIDQNRRRLLSTMNSVIEYSRMQQEESKLEIKNVSITDIVDETQQEISDILKNKGIDFAYGRISSSLSFSTDSQKFTSLITLLFKIASQFAGTNKIYFSAYQFNDKNFLISIQDNYSSMSPSFSDNFNTIFNKRNIQKEYGISKLSIKLARDLIDLLQGKFVEKSQKISGFIFPVELKPEEGKKESTERFETEAEKEKVKTTPGTTEIKSVLKEERQSVEEEKTGVKQEEISEPEVRDFGFEEEEELEPEYIPPAISKKKTKDILQREKPAAKSKIDLSQLNCLYIEDQVDSQILFKVQLKELNEIKFTVSLEEALPLLDTHHFDFIVLDINLQGEYNGLDALRIIHRMPGYETIPIIAVTAYVLPGDREKFIAAGFDDFISKPIFRDKMMASLEKIFYSIRS